MVRQGGKVADDFETFLKQRRTDVAKAETKLYELDLQMIVVPIKGITPLLMNRFTEEAKKSIEDGQQGTAKRGKTARDPEAEFKAAQYRTESGGLYVPGAAFKEAMVRAAKATGMAMVDARTAFHVIGQELPLICSEPYMRSDRVVIGRGTTTMAYRAAIDEWQVDVPIRFNGRAISAEQLVNLLQLAGFGVGILAWRVECKGSFGIFEVNTNGKA